MSLPANIPALIFRIRGLYVMFDKDLAELYEVETRVLNQAVRRNKERFPNTFMFQLTKEEFEDLGSQEVTTSGEESLRSQIVTLDGRGKHRKYLPYVFTEQGVAMLSGVLRSKTAIRVSIQIMEAFVVMRRFLQGNKQLFEQIDQKLLEHDTKFEQIFQLIDEKNLPEKGIFFDGQVFDAYKFVVDLVKSAKKSIVLIDRYVDESVLVLFSKRKDVVVTIYTQLTAQVKLDVEKFNAQYEPVVVKEFTKSHDRFLIIDDDMYHFGASLKD